MIDPFTSTFWIKVGVSVLCGGVIGFERQIRGKPAGIRTSILICLGTQVFVSLGSNLNNPQIDPTRVVAQVMTGVGFIGAGVIMSQEGLVKGVTSAAVIWMLAAIGATIGLNQIAAAISLALVTISILIGVEFLEGSILHLRKGAHAKYNHHETFENGTDMENDHHPRQGE